MYRTKPILTERAIELRKNQTEAEKLLWARLRTFTDDGTKFRRQQPIDDYIVDFVHLGKRLIIEVDGGQHNKSQNIARDNKRTAYLENQGFHLMRFWDSDVLRNMDGVLEKIGETLAELSPSPFSSPVEGEEKDTNMIAPLEWQGDKLRLLDQTRLPKAEVWLELRGYQQVAHAIRTMQVRGAPAIGVAAAYGIALGALGIKSNDPARFKSELETVFQSLGTTRPTARNLFSSIERMRQAVSGVEDVTEARRILVAEAVAIHNEQMEADRTLSVIGASLLKPGSTILTHCNTGPLATAGYGTALGIIICAHQQGKVKQVFATETRPLCQGARLTAWELKQAGIPFKLITDSMAGYVMQNHMVDTVIVGADRIARNGDTANKIGTYMLAVLAKENGIPFYVAAPTTTIDKSIATGAEIVIEQRSPDEVTCIGGVRVAPEGVEVLNPAFDVTPARYITAIVTEEGVWKPVNREHANEK